MGTPAFAVPALKMLAHGEDEVVCVVTQPDRPKGRGLKAAPPPVKELALENGIEVLQPLRTRNDAFPEKLAGYDPDLIVVAAYGHILTRRVLETPRLGCINIHASLLPKYRGPAPINRAVINGDAESGVTIMEIVEEVDAGDILLARSTEIGPDETARDLHDRLSELGGEALMEALEGLRTGSLRPSPQDHSAVTVAPMLKKADGEIDWARPAKALHDFVRGMFPWPGAFTLWRGRNLKIHETRVGGTVSGAEPGVVVAADRDGIVVSGLDACLLVRTLQLEGGQSMDAGAFLTGHSMKPGDRLGRTP